MDMCTVCGKADSTVDSDYNAYVDADWDIICQSCYDWCRDVVLDHSTPTVDRS